MMTREEALAVLGLGEKSQAERADIQRAFERLSRRYPPAHFPERFASIQAARDRLLDEGRYWRDVLISRTIDLSWLQQYLPDDPVDMIKRKEDKAWLQELLRSVYLEWPLGDDHESEFDAILGRIMRQMGGKIPF